MYPHLWQRDAATVAIGQQWVETRVINATKGFNATKVLTLNNEGKDAWRRYAIFCGSSVYPRLDQQAGCIFGLSSLFLSYVSFGSRAINGASGLSWDVEAFVLPSNAVLAGHTDRNGWARPTMLYEYIADGSRVVTSQQMQQMLCELGTSPGSFLSWIPCMFNGIFIPPNQYTHSLKYDTLPFRFDVDPDVGAYGDDGVHEQLTGDSYERVFSAEDYEAGVDKQIAFMGELARSPRTAAHLEPPTALDAEPTPHVHARAALRCRAERTPSLPSCPLTPRRDVWVFAVCRLHHKPSGLLLRHQQLRRA